MRRKFAQEICARTRVASPRLVEAFSSVERERFFGPGPWNFLKTPSGYRPSPDDDPKHLYRDATVAIDSERTLHSGQPSLIALLISHLELGHGARVVHIGAGTGYFSAVLAELVGAKGRVVALEVDAELADRARRNLTPWEQIEVREEDGTAIEVEPADAILVHAGVTRPPSVWLESLRPKGRLVFPLTDRENRGGCLRVIAAGDADRSTDAGRTGALDCRFVLYGGAFPCAASRRDGQAVRIASAFSAGGWEKVRSIRRGEHAVDSSCWLHEPGFCLALEKVAGG